MRNTAGLIENRREWPASQRENHERRRVPIGANRPLFAYLSLIISAFDAVVVADEGLLQKSTPMEYCGH